MTVPDPTLITDIYNTVVDPDLWPRILDRVAAMVNARGCIVFDLIEDGPDGPQLVAPFMSSNYDPAEVAAYLRTFMKWEMEDQQVFARYSAAADRVDLIGDHVLAPTPEALAERPNAKAMAQVGIVHRAGALLSKDQPLRDRFSVQFSARHGPLGSVDMCTLDQILPHLAKACEIARPVRQLQLRGALLADSIDRLNLGVCLIRSDRSVVVHNEEFRRQLDEVRLFRMTTGGQLVPSDSKYRAWFAEMTAAPERHGRFGARPRKEALGGDMPNAPGLAVEITPIASAKATGERRHEGFMICSLDTTRAIEMDTDMVGKVLGLSGSESALLELMAEGLTNRQIAGVRERSVETINSQVKSLLSKTSCANRTQLIRRASNIGAAFVRHL